MENITQEVVAEDLVVTEEAVEIAERIQAETKETRKAFDATLEKVNADQDALKIELEEREAQLFAKEIEFELKANDLEAFKDIINVKDSEELKAVIEALKGIVGQIKLDTGFIPKDSAKQDAFTVAEQNKDVKGMLGSKFSKLFK